MRESQKLIFLDELFYQLVQSSQKHGNLPEIQHQGAGFINLNYRQTIF